MKYLLTAVFFLIIVLQTFHIRSDNASTLPSRNMSSTQVQDNNLVGVIENVMPSVATVVMNHDPSEEFETSHRLEEDLDSDENIGSGFVVSREGLIVTNKHVVSDTDVSYSVMLNDKRYQVQSIYRDPMNDIAILTLNVNDDEKKQLKPVQFGDTASLKVGEATVAIGTILGNYQNSVTTGIISGLGRGIPVDDTTEQSNVLIQTSAPINDGNSGGPLFNASGKVIGVTTAVDPDGESIGFAIPINVVEKILEDYKNS